MVDLNILAEKNLDILCKLENNNLKYNRLYLKLIENREEECERIVDIREIDHIIYFTFHQLILKINKMEIIGNKQENRIQTLNNMDNAIDNIYKYFTITDTSKLNLILMQIEDYIVDIKNDKYYNFYKSINILFDFILTPIYDVVESLQSKYELYYNSYNFICYKNNIEIIDKIYNEEGETDGEDNNEEGETDGEDNNEEGETDGEGMKKEDLNLPYDFSTILYTFNFLYDKKKTT